MAFDARQYISKEEMNKYDNQRELFDFVYLQSLKDKFYTPKTPSSNFKMNYAPRLNLPRQRKGYIT
jgi:hypothetical protein